MFKRISYNNIFVNIILLIVIFGILYFVYSEYYSVEKCSQCPDDNENKEGFTLLVPLLNNYVSNCSKAFINSLECKTKLNLELNKLV